MRESSSQRVHSRQGITISPIGEGRGGDELVTLPRKGGADESLEAIV